MSDNIILQADQLSKTYQEGSIETSVLKGVSLKIEREETLAILGASGSGKSTLLHVLGGLDSFNSGEVTLMGQAYSALTDEAKTILRGKYLGFVYQFHHLLPEFTAVENVMMPLLIQKMKIKEAMFHATDILERVGLSHRLTHKPSALSGGERQRVAIARALVKKPALILADEPTGNLDKTSAQQVIDLMRTMSRECGSALVVVTHDEKFAHQMDRVVVMNDGRAESVATGFAHSK